MANSAFFQFISNTIEVSPKGANKFFIPVRNFSFFRASFT